MKTYKVPFAVEMDTTFTVRANSPEEASEIAIERMERMMKALARTRKEVVFGDPLQRGEPEEA